MFIKYPKTRHIGEYVEKHGALDNLMDADKTLVVEEKMDGTQVGIRFDKNGKFEIQSRGSIISSESEFSLLKQWIWQHQAALFECLGSRYILFGEWLYAKHTVYYDLLPHYLMEFDIYDCEKNYFMSTAERQSFLQPLNFLSSVRVIDCLNSVLTNKMLIKRLEKMIDKSQFISDGAFSSLESRAISQTDTSGLMEGLYLKVENGTRVLERFKLIRPEFIRKIVESETHWKRRPILKNRLIDEANQV